MKEIRECIKKELNLSKDPLDENAWALLERTLPKDTWAFFPDRDGAAKFLEKLPKIFQADNFFKNKGDHDSWEKIGLFYQNIGRIHEALSLHIALYDKLLSAQESKNQWIQKATPLVWMGDCYSRLGCNVLSKRCLMLAHCEDSIALEGKVSPSGTGVYFRLAWGRGLPDSELKRYAKEIYETVKQYPEESLYPEWILQQLDQGWMTEIPSPMETGIYMANTRYVSHLISALGEKSGETLEILSEYILSCIPGCKTKRRQHTPSSDLDVVCSMEGLEIDFRSEFGRYFICECKDWDKPADFSAMAKFSRVVESTRTKFGILFSKNGFSGENHCVYAAREQLKVFHDYGTTIIVIDMKDLEDIAEGRNFIDLLRIKYERVRLDLA